MGNGKAHLGHFFTVTQIIIFLISSTSAPKNSSKRRALFSECGGMRGCSGMDEDEAGKKKKSQYTHYKKLDYTTALSHTNLSTRPIQTSRSGQNRASTMPPEFLMHECFNQ